MNTLTNSESLDALISEMAHRRIVMLGEASHGTHEYYTWRTAISKRLISEHAFNFIAVEGDWPDCYKINRFIKGYQNSFNNIEGILDSFNRWPTWMWANWEVAALAIWLREDNDLKTVEKKTGFYGLDVYSLWDSMRAMLEYLEKEDPEAAQKAMKAYQCFEPFMNDEEKYARLTYKKDGCREQVINLLQEIRKRAQFLNGDREAGFNAEQNALIAVNAENYYSTMLQFNNESWNIRDNHMMETLTRLLQFHGPDSKAIVWAHNTHIGDAKATDMSRQGMVNLGRLARERYGDSNVYLCGFSGYRGSVMAGNEWGAPMREMEVPEAKKGSIEERLFSESEDNRYLLFSEPSSIDLDQPIPHRAIGVVYNPMNEMRRNYVPSFLKDRYDALLYFTDTTALHPYKPKVDRTEIPDTYPFAF